MFSNEQKKQLQLAFAKIENEFNHPMRCFYCESYQAKKFMREITDLKDRSTFIPCCPQCVDFVHQERQKLMAHRNLDKPAPQENFLDLKSWIATLKHFQQRCAYCTKNSYQELDHFFTQKSWGKNDDKQLSARLH